MRRKYTLPQARVLFCLLVLAIQLLGSIRLYAQSDKWENDKVTLRISSQPLGKVLDRVAKEAKASIKYNNTTLVNINSKVTINAKNLTVKQIIAQLLSNQSVVVSYEPNRIIVISPKGTDKQKGKHGARFPISGMVVGGDDKEPLIGATVLIVNRGQDGAPTGVQTDINGKFSLVVNEKSALKISYIGYETKTVDIDKPNTNLQVVLTPNTLAMDEVVVTGISRRSESSFTGNFINIRGAELRKMNPSNVLNSLQFFDPSFKIVENMSAGADPNAAMGFQIRGQQTFDKGGVPNTMDQMLDNVSARPNQPLFVLDGFIVPMSRILSLDPERIQSVTLLKDAAATSIYGSRASNGVIVIETKVARDGALSVSYNTNMVLQVPDLTDYNMMNAREKLEAERLAGLYPEDDVTSLNEYNRYLRNIRAGVDTYWLSQPLRSVLQHRHSLNVGGGTEVFRYSINLNAGFTPGVMKESSNNSKALNLHMSYRKQKMTIGADITLTETDGTHSPYGSFSQYTRVNPYYRPRSEQGEILDILDVHKAGGRASQITNPLYNATIGVKQFQNNLNIANNLNIEYRILKNLRLTEQLSYTKGIARSEHFRPANHTSFVQESDLTKRGSYTKSIGEMSSWSSNLGLNWNLGLKKHLLSLFANWTISENRNNYVNLSAKGYPDVNMDDFIFGATMDTNPSGTEAISRSMGLISQFSYSYDNRYSFDFNLSAEASSRFGSEQRLAPFWSTGLRWNAYQEKWLQGKVSNLVFRASYGVTGEQNFSPYEAIEFYTFTRTLKPYRSFANLGAIMSGLNNPELSWAKTNNLSLGFDFGLFNNRLNGTFNYYNNITHNLLTQYDLAPSTGFDSQTMNAGKLQNKGFDVSLNFIALQNLKKELYWTIAVNANHNKNKIKAISERLQKLNERALNSRNAPTPIFQVGNSTTTLYSVRSLGIDPITGEEVYLKKDGTPTFIWDPIDKVAVGDTAPLVSGTISSSLNWKDFSFTLGLTYRYGGLLYNNTLVDKIENASLHQNLDRRAVEGRWEKVGDVTRFKKIEPHGNSTPQSTRFLMKDNELKLATLSLGYRLNERKHTFLKKLHIESMSFNFTTNELLRLSPVRMERGLDYPFARSFTLSMSVLFK